MTGGGYLATAVANTVCCVHECALPRVSLTQVVLLQVECCTHSWADDVTWLTGDT
jgi:hypothetical protein